MNAAQVVTAGLVMLALWLTAPVLASHVGADPIPRPAPAPAPASPLLDSGRVG